MTSSTFVEAGGVPVSCYIHEIPPFIEDELAKSYETLESSIQFFKVFRSIERASCYVARRPGHPSTVLLFTCNNRRIDVLNEMIEIDQPELHRFASYIFTQFGQVDIISFKALKTTTCKFGFPVQKHFSKGNYVIALPRTPEEYARSIGKSTRAELRHKTNRVLKELPSFDSRFFLNEDIHESHIREIIAFSENKINAKGVKWSHDAERVIALAKMCGFVNVIFVNGRVCAGSVNYRIGSSYFGGVTGYDPQYEKYGLGSIGAYQTICESIASGGTKFYLGGGAFEFKQKLLGVPIHMDEINIYRSYPKMLAHLDSAAGSVIVGYVRELKKILHQNKKKVWARWVFKSFYFFRNGLMT